MKDKDNFHLYLTTGRIVCQEIFQKVRLVLWTRKNSLMNRHGQQGQNIPERGGNATRRKYGRQTANIGSAAPSDCKRLEVERMPKRTFDRTAPYQSISGASIITGLARGYIRDGCKSGKIPHLMVGGEYRVCMSLFLQQLEAEAVSNMKSEVRA